jgi:predicted transcriptional regulator
MKRTTIFLEERLERDLLAVARREGRPMGAVVREAIARYVRLRTRSLGTSASFIAMGQSGHRDTAERHEDLLWKDLAPHERAEPAAGTATTRHNRKSRPTGRRRRA